MKYLLLLLLTFSAHAQSILSPQFGYLTRIQQIEELGELVPGTILPVGGEWRNVGMWGGILIQTEWQLDTGRSNIRMWEVINHTLTTLPYQIHEAYLRSPVSACANFQEARKACDAWVKFFRAAHGGQFGQQKLMWHAHTQSLVAALKKYRPLYVRGMQETPHETRYLLNWTDIVFLIEQLNIPSHDGVIKPFSRYHASCSPLDDKACRKSLKGLSRLSATVLSLKPISVDSLIRKLENGIEANPL